MLKAILKLVVGIPLLAAPIIAIISLTWTMFGWEAVAAILAGLTLPLVALGGSRIVTSAASDWKWATRNAGKAEWF